MGVSKTCDICKMSKQVINKTTMEPEPDVFRFNLRRDLINHRIPGKRPERIQRSMGGIDLCTECWTRIAGKRVRLSTRKSTLVP